MSPLRALVLFALLSMCSTSYAQRNPVDSLESLVLSVPSDTNKLWLLNNLVSLLREKDNNKALSYATQAKDLAELLRDKKGQALALENLGWILYRRGDFSKSFDLSMQAHDLNETLGDEHAMARCLINLAAIHFEQKQYEQAITHFNKAFHISERIGDKKTMARSLNNIAFSFQQLGKYDSAYRYVRSALAISETVKDPYMTAFALRTIGDVHVSRKEPEQALTNFNKCLAIALAEGNTFLRVSTLHRLGKVYKEQGEYDKAIEKLKENLELASRYSYQEELERTYKLLSEVYAARNEINKAFHFQSKYMQIHDSLYSQRQSEQIALMQTRFDGEIKQAQIDLLTKEAQLNEEEIKSQKIWLYFSIGCMSLMLILAFVLFYTNRYNSLAKRQLQEKNEAIHSQAQQLRNLNATKDKLFSIISHDLRSPLASLKALMELVGTPGLTEEEFTNITRILKRNLDTVHEDLDNLLLWAQTQLKGLQAMPETVRLRGLAEEKIRLFKEAANTKGITITNNIPPETVAVADKNHVGIVLRNLIANAIKFNQPGGTIEVSVQQHEGICEVSVSDTGVGISMDDLDKLFNPETHFTKPGTSKEKGVGIGLLITKEFVESNNGTIRVASELGKGTTFTFTLKASTVRMPSPVAV